MQIQYKRKEKMEKIEAVFIDRDGTIGNSAEVEFPHTFVAFDYRCNLFTVKFPKDMDIILSVNRCNLLSYY